MLLDRTKHRKAWKSLLRRSSELARDFRDDESGNVAVIFAAASVPLFVMMGGAIDFERYNRHKTFVTSAVDASVIALAKEADRRGNMTTDQAKQFVRQYMEASVAEHDGLHFDWNKLNVVDLKASGSGKEGYRVDFTGSVDTYFLPLIQVDQLALDITTEAEITRDFVEVALALDVTGSMYGWKIEALRDSATLLVNTLLETQQDRNFMKVALVPYVTSVNIKANRGYRETWIDKKSNGPTRARYNGSGLDRGTDYQGWGHYELYQQLSMNNPTQPELRWAGCVEARPSRLDLAVNHPMRDLDIRDVSPNPSNPDTTFVPYFWPDEPGTKRSGHGNSSSAFNNSYVSDNEGSTAAEKWTALRDMDKYFYKSAYDKNNGIYRKDITIPRTSNNGNYQLSSGPNKGCPRPMTNLTSDPVFLRAEIGRMVATMGSGTNSVLGLMWGWRILSPGEPFDSGTPYNVVNVDGVDRDLVKAVVLMTDGNNQTWGASNEVTKSDYTSYGYVRMSGQERRFGGAHDANVADDRINERLAAACDNVKAPTPGGTREKIRIYTITFSVNDPNVQSLYENCASVDSDTGLPLYFNTTDEIELSNAFREIAQDLSNVRIVR